MQIEELFKEVINELKNLNIPIQYVNNQLNVSPPHILFNYLTYDSYYSNDHVESCVVCVTLNLIFNTIEYEKTKFFLKEIKKAGYHQVARWQYENESRTYVIAFDKEFIVKE